MKINKFFVDVLGANLRNPRWSWGAVEPTSNRVFLRVWDDEIRPIGQTDYVQVMWKDNPGLGARERRAHIEAMRSGAEGFGVVCKAVDVSTERARAIKSYDPNELLVLGDIVERGDTLLSVIVDRVDVNELRKPQTGQSTLSTDLLKLVKGSSLDQTHREQLIDARLGQGVFRARVLAQWKGRCAVTGSGTLEAIRASHIKPWRDSSDVERLDPDNGLPLAANLDALFDCGFISFEDSGAMLVSTSLTAEERALLGVKRGALSKAPSSKSAMYLAHHREFIFRP